MPLAPWRGPPAQDRGAGGERGANQRGACPATSSHAPPRPCAAAAERPGCPRGWDRAPTRHRGGACSGGWRPRQDCRRAPPTGHRQRHTRTNPPRPRQGTLGPGATGPFFPQPPPSGAAWRRGQRRAGRAPGANTPGGRAPRLRPRGGPPERSPPGDTDAPVGPEQRGRRSNTCDTSYSHGGKRSPAAPADTPHRASPNHAASDETAWPDRPRGHNAGTVVGGRCAWRGRARVVAGLRGRCSRRWGRGGTHLDRTSGGPPGAKVRPRT